MTNEQEVYTAIGHQLAEAQHSQLFGKPCFKVNGKAFIYFFQQCMVFKLPKLMHREALSLDGAQLFDPSGKKRPMKEWVQLPFDYVDRWENYAKVSYEYVKLTSSNQAT